MKQIKYRISKQLFDFIINDNLFKKCDIIYAYAWEKISNILVKHYGFSTLKYKYCITNSKLSTCYNFSELDKILQKFVEKHIHCFGIERLNFDGGYLCLDTRAI